MGGLRAWSATCSDSANLSRTRAVGLGRASANDHRTATPSQYFSNTRGLAVPTREVAPHFTKLLF